MSRRLKKLPSITNKLIFLAVIVLLLAALFYSKGIKGRVMAGLAYFKETSFLQQTAPNMLKENSSPEGKKKFAL